MLSVCILVPFDISSSYWSKGKAKGKTVDNEVFCVLLGVDLTVICCFTCSYCSSFVEVVLPGKVCEETEPGSYFHLKDYFLISVSIN